MIIATLANVSEILAWASVLVNLWWFHRRIIRLEIMAKINRIEIAMDDPDKFSMRTLKGGRS